MTRDRDEPRKCPFCKSPMLPATADGEPEGEAFVCPVCHVTITKRPSRNPDSEASQT